MRSTAPAGATTLVLSLLVSLLAAAMPSGCARFDGLSPAAAGLAQVPISDSPSGEIFPGTFVWHDLLTPDLEAAGSFYQNLFGWHIDYHDYAAVVRNDGLLIATMVEMEPATTQMRGTWIPSASVEDVDAAASRAAKEGGTVLRGPAAMGQRGRAALIRDFQGADLVLLRAPGGDPPGREAAIGDWLWDEIWSSDPQKSGIFYTSVLGYDRLESVQDDYTVFFSGDDAQAGLRHLGAESRNRRWVPVVRVADPAATCRRAEELGGTVRVRPEDAPDTGNTALISDPTGAYFLVQRWPSEPAEGGK